MSVFKKTENLNISKDSKIYNTQTIIDFIYKFNKEFNMEIVNIDSNSEERTFRIHYLYYKESIQKDTIIDISCYDEKINYFLETKGMNEISFRNNYKSQIDFIKYYL